HLADHEAPDRVQARLGLDCGEEPPQRGPECLVAEEVEPRLAARGGDQRALVERRLEARAGGERADPVGDRDRARPMRTRVAPRGLAAHRARSSASFTTRVRGSGCSFAPIQRQHIVPWRCPAVSIQFGRPGSSWATTTRTEPSGSRTAVCLFTWMRWWR